MVNQGVERCEGEIAMHFRASPTSPVAGADRSLQVVDDCVRFQKFALNLKKAGVERMEF